MATFTVLDQPEEDKLHATRLLSIEERPFRRITKRLLAPTTPIGSFLGRQKVSDEAADEAAAEATEDAAPAYDHEQFLKSIQRFREEVILDFATFNSSIARIQLLRAANERERERYAAEKVKIESTAEEVRDNTASLRAQLEKAQETLTIRKTYDVLADKITKNAALKPRDEQHVNIEKLKAEIEELERESLEHSQAWLERREQFAKVVNEGARLRRVIRDEKEPEKDDDAAEDEHVEDDMLRVGREREGEGGSNTGTPRPLEDAPTPLAGLHAGGAMTPRPNLHEGGGATPRPTVDEDVDMVEAIGSQANEEASGPTVNVEKATEEMDTT